MGLRERVLFQFQSHCVVDIYISTHQNSCKQSTPHWIKIRGHSVAFPDPRGLSNLTNCEAKGNFRQQCDRLTCMVIWDWGERCIQWTMGLAWRRRKTSATWQWQWMVAWQADRFDEPRVPELARTHPSPPDRAVCPVFVFRHFSQWVAIVRWTCVALYNTVFQLHVKVLCISSVSQYSASC